MDNLENIFKAIRLVPEFDGNPNVLTRFIRLCDQLVNEFVSNEPGNELKNIALINGILNKVTGPAARLINSNGIPENWIGIRNALINNFADQRDETSLYNDLALLNQGNTTPQEFYEKCQNLFSTIMTYISLHETILSTVESKRTLYKKLTLQSYLRGLRDPLGSRIRCMRPDTIEKALEFVHEEMNILYLQQRDQNVPDKRSQYQHKVSVIPKLPFGHIPPPIAMPAPRPFNLHMPRPYNVSPPFQNYIPKPWKSQMDQNLSPSRTRQIFSATPPNYRPQSNVFKLTPHRMTENKIQPMSGVSHYVTKPFPSRQPHDWMKTGNPPPSNYFKTKEINFNEFYDQPDYDPYYEQFYHEYYNDYPDYSSPIYYEPTQFSETEIVEDNDETKISPPISECEDFREKPQSDKLK